MKKIGFFFLKPSMQECRKPFFRLIFSQFVIFCWDGHSYWFSVKRRVRICAIRSEILNDREIGFFFSNCRCSHIEESVFLERFSQSLTFSSDRHISWFGEKRRLRICIIHVKRFNRKENRISSLKIWVQWSWKSFFWKSFSSILEIFLISIQFLIQCEKTI